MQVKSYICLKTSILSNMYTNPFALLKYLIPGVQFSSRVPHIFNTTQKYSIESMLDAIKMMTLLSVEISKSRFASTTVLSENLEELYLLPWNAHVCFHSFLCFSVSSAPFVPSHTSTHTPVCLPSLFVPDYLSPLLFSLVFSSNSLSCHGGQSFPRMMYTCHSFPQSSFSPQELYSYITLISRVVLGGGNVLVF